MEIIYGLENLPPLTKRTVLTVGNFDGVHLGHQKILNIVSSQAKNLNSFSLVVTFSPHPEKFLGKRPIKMIQTLNQRLEAISKFNIDKTIVTRLDQKTLSLTAEEFIKKILVNKLKIREIYIGHNFHFGRNRQGNIKTLYQMGKDLDFRAFSIPLVKQNGTKVSSSLIRNLLIKGEIEKANLFLGRPYSIKGEVILGHSRGKDLGFPTANLNPENEILPQGVFITLVTLAGKDYKSLTNIGYCPTFGQKILNVEVHILDFYQEIYGEKLIINFLKRIRAEKKFNRPKDLSAQIKLDIKLAQNFFSKEFK
ncbi:MAG: bifunctional riboflavin kinase/FAD synthetase [Candidatus Aminicenantia bacterium]